jgi:hypothetical protein
MNFNVKYLTAFISIFLVNLTGCGITSTMYLQSFSGYTQDNTYGFIESNPILLKGSEKYNYDLIIDEFISRLYSKGIQEAGYEISNDSIIYRDEKRIDMQSFLIQTKKKILDGPEKIVIEEINDKDDYYNTLFIYDIISKDQKIKYRLFFRLTKNNQKFYAPNEFFYSMLCG